MMYLGDNTTPFPNRETLERIIIGSLLQNYEIVHIAQANLEVDDFDTGPNQLIFEAILNTYADGQGVDIITVLDRLRRQGIEHRAGGAKYLVELTDAVSNTVHFEHHVQIFKQWAMLRAMQTALVTAHDNLFNEQIHVLDNIDRLTLELGKISGRVRQVEEQTAETIIHQMWAEIEQGLGNGIDITDLEGLNDTIQGILPGDLFIVAGRPGAGKSVFMSNVLRKAIADDRRLLVWSLEMTNISVMQRALSAITKIPYKSIAEGDLSQARIDKLDQASQQIIDAGALFVERSAVSAADIRSHLVYLKSTGVDIDTVLIDHGGLLNAINPQNQNTVEEIGNTSKLLKQTAKELGIRIILLWQLNRQAAKGNVPTLSDLRASGRLEEDADKVLLIHRPELYANSETTFLFQGQEYTTENAVQFIVAKNRRGPTGTVIAEFDKACFRFKDYSALPF